MRYRLDSVPRPAAARPRKARPRLEWLEGRITPSVTVDYWTGGSATSNNWMDGGNWQGGAAPSPGDALVFPTGVTNTTATNDFPAGTVFDSIEIDDPGYTFSGGNSVALNTGIDATYTAGSLTFPLNVTLDASQTVTVAPGGTLDLAASIDDGSPSNGYALNLVGGGTLELDNPSTYTGGTTVSAGTMLITDPGALGTGTVTVGGTGALEMALTGTNTIANALVLDSNAIPSLSNDAGSTTISGAITLGAGDDSGQGFNAAVHVGTGSTLTLSNTIAQYTGAGAGSAYGVALSGGGTLTYAGTLTSTYTGTTAVQDGTLEVDGSIASSSDTTVEAGAILGGTGTISALDAQSGATVQPDLTGSPAVLQTGAATLESGSTLAIGIDGVAQNDQLSSSGAVGLSGATLAVSLNGGYIAKPGTVFTILSATGGVSGTFNGLADGTTVFAGTYPFTVHYLANSVTLTAQARTLTWSGGAGTGDTNWAAAVNWWLNGTTAPATPGPYDALVFPGNSYPTASVNNLPSDTELTSIQLDAYGLKLSGNSIILDKGITTTYNIGTTRINLGIALGGNQSFSVGQGGTLLINGAISGSSGLTKDGAGKLVLQATNTYGGGTTVEDGIVLAQNNSNVFGTGTVTINSDSTASTWGEVQVSSTSILQIPNAFVLNSNDAAGDPVIQNIAGVNFITGTVDLLTDATVDVAFGTVFDFSGSISGSASLTETGSGRLVLGTSNSYSGGTFVDGGNLAVDWPTDNLGTGPVTVNNDAQMVLFTEPNFPAGSSIAVNNAITLNTTSAAAIENMNGPSTLNGPITLEQPATIEADSGAPLTITGAIDDGGNGYGITKTGVDTVQLTGTSTYTGATNVSGGTLQVDGDITASSGVHVSSGTLDGAGRIPALTATGGTVLPGTSSSTGILTAGNVSLATGSAFNVAINGMTPGPNYSQLITGGTINLDSGSTGGATLNVTLGFTPSVGQSFTLIANGGGSPVQGTFQGLPEGATFMAGGQTFQITYAGGPNHNDVVLTDKATPTVAVTAAPTPSQFGQSVTFSVTVSGGSGTPTGTVTFYDGDPASGGQPIGTPQTLDGSGQASISTASLAIGTHPIFAQYSGDPDYLPLSSSLPGGQTVTADTTTTSVASDQALTIYGTQVVFTALVSQAFGGTPTGLVDFFDGATPIGTGTLNALGIATLATTTLDVSGSPHSITARYEGSPTSQSSSSGTYSQTITPAALTITANGLTKTYGQAITFAGTEFTTAGLANGDTVSSVSLSSTGAAATAGVAGSPYAITASAATGSGLTNYTIRYVPGQLTVDAAPLTITANSTSKTYGQTTTFAGTEFSTNGLVNGDSVGSVTLSSAGAAATAGVAGSPYAINASTATGSGLTNYTIRYVPGQLTVDAAPLTITPNSTSKTYGDTVSFAGTEFSASGLVNGDSVSAVTLSSAGAAATAGVAGSPYAIDASSAVGTGLDNYTVTYQPGQLTVTPAALTIRANSTSKTYGQTTAFAGTEFSTSGLVNGDHVDLVSLSSAGAAATAGVAGSPYAISASGAVGSGLGNYAITYMPGQLAVAPAPLTVTADSAGKVYGQTTTFAGTEISTSGLVNGDTVDAVTLASAGAAATANVAGSPYAISATSAVGTGLDNYTIAYVPGQLAVTPASLTITANDAAKTYGQTLTFAGTEFTTSGLVNGDAVNSVTLASAGAPASAGVAGSPYAASASSAAGTGLDNYSITYAPGQLSVAAAPLTISANDVSRLYGAPNPPLTASYSGFVNGDTPSSLTNPVALSTTATPASPVGQYPIVASGASSPNYAIRFRNGTLSIAQASSTSVLIAPATASVFGQRVSYSALVHSAGGGVPSGSLLFVVDGQPAAQASIDPNTGLATFATSDLGVGTHTIAAEFPVNSNITAGFSATSTLVVSPASTSAVVAAHYVTRGLVDVGATVAALPPGGGTPTGTVTFFVGRRRLGTTQLAGGAADLLFRPGQVRNRPLTVQYGGDANFLPSSSSAVLLGRRGTSPAVRRSIAAHGHTGHHSRTH